MATLSHRSFPWLSGLQACCNGERRSWPLPHAGQQLASPHGTRALWELDRGAVCCEQAHSSQSPNPSLPVCLTCTLGMNHFVHQQGFFYEEENEDHRRGRRCDAVASATLRTHSSRGKVSLQPQLSTSLPPLGGHPLKASGRAAEDGSSTSFPANHVGDQSRGPGCSLQPGLVLAV